jgi:hypothetical protein
LVEQIGKWVAHHDTYPWLHRNIDTHISKLFFDAAAFRHRQMMVCSSFPRGTYILHCAQRENTLYYTL